MDRVVEAFDYVDKHFETMLEELRRLCIYRSVKGDNNGLASTRSAILEKMNSIGLSVNQFPIPDGNAVLYGQRVGESSKTLLLYNHYDVVHEGKRELWHSDPFMPEIREGILYGRGVSDNKGTLLARLQAVDAILATVNCLPLGLRFMMEGDEETGSTSLYRFVESDPGRFSDLTESDYCLWEGGKRDGYGYPRATHGCHGGLGITLRVTSTKYDTHSRMGIMLPNAAWRLVWALASLKNVQEQILIDGFYDSVLAPTDEDRMSLEALPFEEETLKEQLGIGQYLLGKSGYPLKEWVYMQPSLTVCGLDSGETSQGVRSVVPHSATAHVTFNLVANQEPGQVLDLLKRHLVHHGFSDVSVEERHRFTPVRTPLGTEYTRALGRALARVYDKPMVVELSMLGGGPQIPFRQAHPNLPIVGIGASNEYSGNHGPNENIVVEDYRQAIKAAIAIYYELGG